MTEMATLKKKKKDNKATQADLERLKILQDAEPLTVGEIAEAQRREDDRAAKDKADFEAKQRGGQPIVADIPGEIKGGPGAVQTASSLDIPAEHPRIVKLKAALMPFTQLEAHHSRPDDFILITRGVSITAGDVRAAIEAMKL